MARSGERCGVRGQWKWRIERNYVNFDYYWLAHSIEGLEVPQHNTISHFSNGFCSFSSLLPNYDVRCMDAELYYNRCQKIAMSSFPLNPDLPPPHVSVYLRNYRKIAKLVSLPSSLPANQLLNFVAVKYGTVPGNLALFYNGERIDLMGTGVVELKEKSIVHVVQLDRTRGDRLTLYLRFPAQTEEALSVQAHPKTQIRCLFQSIGSKWGKTDKQVFLAYLGRPVNIFRTFEEQLVEDECEIMVLQFKKAHVRQFENLSHSQQYSKHNISVASTKMLGMPAMGGRSISVLNAKKAKPQSSSIKEELPQELEKLVEIPEEKVNSKSKNEDSAAPGATQESAAPPVYHGFDPMIDSAAPPLQMKPEKNPFSKQPNSSQQANPQDNFKLKEKDLLYMASPTMPQTDHFTAGVVQEFKQAFLKKQSSGKENKK